MSLSLAQNWQLKERDASRSLQEDFASSTNWLPAIVPGTVQQALLAAGQIPDPFDGLHENDIQWIGERDWLYRTTFELPDNWEKMEQLALSFEGLDTFATVWLNGTEILQSENMFVPQQVHITGLLHAGSNELQMLFESPLRRGHALEELYGKRVIWGEGDSSRVYVRKAQYHYGWDWGPVIMTAGPWRAIRLEAYHGKIAHLLCNVEVAADLASARIPLTLDLELPVNKEGLSCHFTLIDPQGKHITELVLSLAADDDSIAHISHEWSIQNPQLWWPRGHGEQPLYQLVAALKQGTRILDQTTLRIGMRRLQLQQHPFADQAGQSFYIEVNNKPIFCGGANWIPADSLLPEISDERYSRWLQLAADANITMLRIWGGGIYEEDIFYNLCDELGILVWQDFMFACGMYPALDWFQESVKAEASAAIHRLHHHPSLALWCGNNEDYMHSYGMGFYDINFNGDLTSIRFDGRQLYEYVLPDICTQLDPVRPYWRGSPYAGKDANDPTQGDQHCWDVWHGPMAHYRRYAELGGRFVSEFGMQAMPVRPTVESFTTPEERYPLSRTLEHHNKAPDGSRRLGAYLSDMGRIPTDLDSYIYATQLLQSEALGSAISSWRRKWQGPGKEYCSGALVWQINDCWPVTSWAFVDYYLRPKPAYYTIRRELAPVTIGIAKNGEDGADIWAVNDTLQEQKAELVLKYWTLNGELIAEEHTPHILLPNQSTELRTVSFAPTGEQILQASLLLNDGEQQAHKALWPEPFKYLTLPEPGITIQQLDEQTVSVQVERPTKGVWLTAEQNPDLLWSDNMLDLFPDQPRRLHVSGLDGQTLHADWLHS